MNYYSNLNAVESEIIRLGSLRSLLTILANAVESSNQEDIENCIWQAKELADSINENLSEEFQNLWDTIRDDSIFEEEESVYDTKPLNDIVDSWIRNK
jgi:5-methylthioribose kinase